LVSWVGGGGKTVGDGQYLSDKNLIKASRNRNFHRINLNKGFEMKVRSHSSEMKTIGIQRHGYIYLGLGFISKRHFISEFDPILYQNLKEMTLKFTFPNMN